MLCKQQQQKILPNLSLSPVLLTQSGIAIAINIISCNHGFFFQCHILSPSLCSSNLRTSLRLVFGSASNVVELEHQRGPTHDPLPCCIVFLFKGAPSNLSRQPRDSPRIQKPGAQDHDCFTRALLELHLDGAELAVDDADHSLDLLWGDGPGPALLSKEVHHVGGEFIACLCGNTVNTGELKFMA